MRETLKPLPPQSTWALGERRTLLKAKAGTLYSRSKAGLRVTV